MKLTVASLLALASVAVLGGKSKCSEDLTVKTETGSYTGVIDPEFPNTRQWRSIPFAEPPVASRRWLPPQKLSSSDEHRYVTRFPPSCPQYVTGIPDLWNSDLTRGNLIYNGAQNDSSGLVGEATSEDCLHLSVFAPSADVPVPEGGFPVLFFMTGGGFYIGGVNIPWQMPTPLVERSQSHIVITINYRVNIFGFPNARGLENGEQNLGILDMRAALEWVHENIAAFGGNPELITQWGRSAGAIAADILSFAYHDDPIAAGYFFQSGTAYNNAIYTTDVAQSNFTFVARHFGCEATCDEGEGEGEEMAAQLELDCMRQIPFTQIINFIGQRSDRGDEPALFPFYPIQDDVIVFKDYHERSERGLFARIPTLISNTANEASSLTPGGDENGGPPQEVVQATNIRNWVCPTYNATVYRDRVDVPVYRIQYAGIWPNLNPYSWLGAYHGGDTTIPFGTHVLMDHVAPSTALQNETAEAFGDYLLAFAEDPYNGPREKLDWMPMDTSDPKGGEIIRLGAGGQAVQTVDGVDVDGVCLGLRDYDAFPE